MADVLHLDCFRNELLLRLRTVLPESVAGCVLLVVDPAWVWTSSDSSLRECSIRRLLLRRNYIVRYFTC